MKAYVVVSGVYSNYRIQAVYTNEKLAKQVVRDLQKLGLEHVSIETYNLNSAVQEIVSEWG